MITIYNHVMNTIIILHLKLYCEYFLGHVLFRFHPNNVLMKFCNFLLQVSRVLKGKISIIIGQSITQFVDYYLRTSMKITILQFKRAVFSVALLIKTVLYRVLYLDAIQLIWFCKIIRLGRLCKTYRTRILTKRHNLKLNCNNGGTRVKRRTRNEQIVKCKIYTVSVKCHILYAATLLRSE